jgi:type I restriction enzyme S subunit
MSVPEGFKQTDVGVIPKDWEVDEIQNLCAITTGDKNTQDRIAGGAYPFFVRSQIVERINSYSFDGEAVLTAGDGVGTGKIFHYINGKFDFHQRVYKMSNFSSRLSGYYFFQYFSNHFYNRISQMTAKSSVDSVRKEMIGKMLIPLPPPAEQTAIAAALSDMDALIEGVEKLLEKKRRIKQGAMQELLRPKEGWVKKMLGDFLTQRPQYGIGAAAVPYNEDLPTYLRITDISEDGRLIKSKLASVDHPFSSDYYLENNDLVFARTGNSVGKSYLYNTDDEKLVFAGFLIRVKVDQTLISPTYLKYFVQSKTYWNWIAFMSMRTGQPGINGQEYSMLPIDIPNNRSEQDNIAAILSDIDSEIVQLETQLTKYRQLKTGMNELAHLLERHHNDRFHALVSQYLPGWKQLRDELNRLPVNHADWVY